MWTELVNVRRKKATKTIAVIHRDRCFGAFACSIWQAARQVEGCIIEERDKDGTGSRRSASTCASGADR
jgi:hypothetical protein